ncbi:mannose-6-phosphate isomerase ManA [mine drainage metagenome]|uniref:Mannose-6-phosphate isomerase ManA n=1 Tax=mine drainage metagenome TaxID=410659 RepID=A0A1J5QBE8_9ZZZZ
MRFLPTYHYRVWGSRSLSNLRLGPASKDDTIGETWLLGDRQDHPSAVADGPLLGWTMRDLMERVPEQLLGSQSNQFHKFPLLLKFLYAHNTLSVQVHPSDADVDLLPLGESGKTEAWVILDTGPDGLVFLGLKPGTTAEDLERGITAGTVPDRLLSFSPKVGDCVLIPAGTVHSLGGDLVVFEIQQNSDVTYRLYDWDRTDPQTGRPRELQIPQALACINFEAAPVGVAIPVSETTGRFLRERLISCEYFDLWRISGDSPFPVGAKDALRVLVLVSGEGEVDYDGKKYPAQRDDALLLPAEVGVCLFHPSEATTLLEISLPKQAIEHT